MSFIAGLGLTVLATIVIGVIVMLVYYRVIKKG